MTREQRLTSEGHSLPGAAEHLRDATELRHLSELGLSVTQLRGVEDADFPVILDWYHHPSIREHFASSPTTVEGLQQVFGGKDIHPLVAVNEFGELVGVLTFRDNLSSGARNGYLERVAVSPDVQGRGIGTAMLRRSLDHAFDASGLNYYKVTLGVVTDITTWERTKHVYEKLGFREGGVWRRHVVISAQHLSEAPAALTPHQQLRDTANGVELLELRDAIWMDLTKDEWRTHAATLG